MSRFHLLTVVVAIVAFAVACLTTGSTRLVLLSLTSAAYLLCFVLGIALIRLQFFGPVVCCHRAAGLRCALTFDDGPDPNATPLLLDLLQEEGVLAAFFCVGSRVSAAPELTRRIARDGHLLANHTYHHGWWTNFLGRSALEAEIVRTQEAVRSATEVTPRYFRPPVGLTNPITAAVSRQLGLTCVGWDVRSLDLTSRNEEKIIQRIHKRCRAGSIILLHDGNADPQRLRCIVHATIAQLRAAGYTFVRLDKLLKEWGKA